MNLVKNFKSKRTLRKRAVIGGSYVRGVERDSGT